MTRYDAERLHLPDQPPRALHRLDAGGRNPRRLDAAICTKFRKVMPVEYRRALAEMDEGARHAGRGVTADG